MCPSVKSAGDRGCPKRSIARFLFENASSSHLLQAILADSKPTSGLVRVRRIPYACDANSGACAIVSSARRDSVVIALSSIFSLMNSTTNSLAMASAVARGGNAVSGQSRTNVETVEPRSNCLTLSAIC